mgnify:CR=1 FL=1
MHITSFNAEIATEFAKRAKEESVTISFNPTQGYANNSFEDVIELADLVQMNRGESEIFTKRHGSIGAVVDNGTDIVVTHGPAGCTFYSTDGLAHHEGFYVDKVIDTVGAGDTFMAGLIYSWVTGKEIRDSLSVANAFGAISIQQIGSPKEIDIGEVNTLME